MHLPANVRIPVGGNHEPITHDLFRVAFLTEGMTVGLARSWAAEAPKLADLPDHDVLFDDDGRRVVIRIAGALVRLRLEERQAVCMIAARSRAATESVLATLKQAWPEAEPEDGRTSRVTFWNWDGRNANSRIHDIQTPPWFEIQANYAARAAAQLDDLLARTTPPDAGRLILWHGPPGTGKTHLIRALAHAWRGWCSTEYVVDIDQLLNGSSEYLVSMLLDHADRQPDQGDDRWRLVVLEDAGEFLMPDAPATQGQGFSRLLNTLDGMLGQTAQLMVLVTTNRPLSALDPSIIRPGRCGHELEIPELSAGEAAAWLARHEHPTPIGGPASLAELYGVLRGDAPPAARRPVGFTA